jgi:hypothetical protein
MMGKLSVMAVADLFRGRLFEAILMDPVGAFQSLIDGSVEYQKRVAR